jgi:hypothetical protein
MLGFGTVPAFGLVGAFICVVCCGGSSTGDAWDTLHRFAVEGGVCAVCADTLEKNSSNSASESILSPPLLCGGAASRLSWYMRIPLSIICSTL